MKIKCFHCGQFSKFWLGDVCLFCHACRRCSATNGDVKRPLGIAMEKIGNSAGIAHTEEGRCMLLPVYEVRAVGCTTAPFPPNETRKDGLEG